MRTLLFLAALFLALSARAQYSVLDVNIAKSHLSPLNLILNPMCERNIANITASSVAPTSTTSGGLNGFTDCSWNPTASGQKITWAMKTLPKGISGANCEARIQYQGQGSSLVKAYVNIGTASYPSGGFQLPGPTSSAVDVSIANFICSETPTLTLESTGDAPNTPYTVYVGEATNIGSVAQATVIGTAYQPGASNCAFSQTTSAGENSWVDLGSAGSCASAWQVTGQVTATGATAHTITINNMPPGDYEFIVDAPFTLSGAGVCSFRFSDGTSDFGFSQLATTSGNEIGTLHGVISYTSPASRTFKIQAADNTTGCSVANDTAGRKFLWTVKRFPSSSEISTRNPLLYYPTYSAKVSSAGVVSDEGTDWLNGNCSVANTSEFTCSFNSGIFSTSGPNCVVTGFDTSTAAPIGKVFTAESTSSVVIKTYNNSATATAFAFRLLCQGSSPASVPVPLLVGSVTSNSSGAERHERATIANNGTASITRQSGSWLSSVTRNGTGDVTINIASGMFSDVPSCNCTAVDSGGNTTTCIINNATTPTTTAVRFLVSAGATASDRGFHVACMGAR
jgi:hypothetical protein